MAETWNVGVAWINRAGELHWSFARAMLVQTLVLAGMLALMDVCLRRRVSPVVRYWLWSLLLLKLLLPVSLRTPASIAYWTVPDSAVVSSETPDRNMNPTRLASLDVEGGLLIAWSAIAVFLGTVVVRRARKVRDLVRRGVEAPREWSATLELASALLDVPRRHVRLLVSEEVGCPAICGFWRPTILIPSRLADRLDSERREFVLVHELCHWRRWDLHVNLLQTILQIVYFYNPALWVANTVLRRLREQAVDDAVLVALALPSQKYTNTLLDVAAVSLRPLEVSLRLIGISESRKALMHRLRRMAETGMPRSARLGLWGAAAVIFAGVVLLPMAGNRRAIADKPPSTSLAKPLAHPQEKAAPSSSVRSGRITDENGKSVGDARIELTHLALKRGVDVKRFVLRSDGKPAAGWPSRARSYWWDSAAAPAPPSSPVATELN